MSQKISREKNEVFLKSKINKTNKTTLNKKISKITNIILFYFVLFLFQGQINTQKIKIQVNRNETITIRSDYFKGLCLPHIRSNPIYESNEIFDNFNNFSDFIGFTDVSNFTNIRNLSIKGFEIFLDFDINCNINNFSYMFNNSEDIISIEIDNMFRTDVNLSYMFINCTNLKNVDIKNNDYIQSKVVKDMRGMFYNCHSLESFSFGNVSLNINKSYNFTELIEIVSIEVTYYEYSDINMSYMFYNCTNLQYISNEAVIIQNISDMSYMFYNCISLEYINLEKFLTGKILRIDLSYMFYNCKKLSFITFNSTIQSFGVKDMKNMFYNCLNLISVNLKLLKVNKDNSFDMSYLFYNCQKLKTIELNNNDFNISDTRMMFYNCKELSSINFIPLYTYDEINMTKMFFNCIKIRSISLNNNNRNFFIYPNDMSSMFYNCYSLVSLDLIKFRTDKVQYIKYMLYNCKALTNFNILSSNFSNILITNMKGVFQNCESVVTLDLSTFYTPNAEIMWDMFKDCKHLQNLNIPNFDTSKVIDMQSMFSGCKGLESLNISHFNTANVQYMSKMFQNCKNLKYLYFSQLESDSLSTMYRMFYNCSSLEYLNVFPLIDDVQSISEMFYRIPNNFTICIKDIENIPNIYKIIGDKITRDCSRNCYGEQEERIRTEDKKRCCPHYTFNNNCYNKCPGKTELQNEETKICVIIPCTDFYNFEQNECINAIPDGYYYKNDINAIDKCHEDCATCYGGATSISKKCLKCNNANLYVYLGNCYEKCRYGYFIGSDGTKKCKCHRKKCKECSEESLKYNLCISCNVKEEYFEKFNDNNYINGFKDCVKNIEGYYLDDYKKYKPCYPSCKYCYKNEFDKLHHNCQNCNDENSFSLFYDNNFKNMSCFPECKYYYYLNQNDDYICTKNLSCPSKYPFLLENTTKCIEKCIEDNKYQFRNTCFHQCPDDSYNYTRRNEYFCNALCPFDKPFEMKETQKCVPSCTIMERYKKLCFTNYDGPRNSEVQDMVLSDFKDDIIDTFDYNIINKTHKLIHEEKKVLYEITLSNSTYHDPRTTTIDLGECEIELKKYYDINKNEGLYIFKVDAFVEGKEGPKVEYEVYYPLNDKNLRLLDLSICEGKEIIIGYCLNISKDELDLYNTNSSYFNDICYTYTNSKGTDITLYDRKEEFMNNNKSYCEEDCKISGYDEIERRLKCSCEIKYSISLISEIKVDKNLLYKFIGIKQIANFEVLKCVKLLLSIKGIQINIGFYSFFPTIIAYIVTLFIFYLKDLRKIMNQINEIIYIKRLIGFLIDKKIEIKRRPRKNLTSFSRYVDTKKIKLGTIKEEVLMDTRNIEDDNDLKIRSKKDINKLRGYFPSSSKKNIFDFAKEEKSKNHDESDANSESIINMPEIKKRDLVKYKYLKHNKIRIGKKSKKKNDDSSKRDFIEAQNIFEVNKVKKEKFSFEEKIKIVLILKFNDTELNELGYRKAIKYDLRNFKQYYISLLFTKHNFIQIFNKNDYNSCSIKVLLAFFNFSSCYAVNALFFNDNTMHQIYEDEGDFNFIYQLPQIAYSTLLSFFIDSLTAFFALSEDDILSLKKDRNVKNIANRGKDIKQFLKLKFFLFFVIDLSLILLFWYYLGCFCAVYRNTQYHLIKDTLISFSVGYITPFGTNILTALLRIYSLKQYSKGKQMIFNLSKIFQKYL